MGKMMRQQSRGLRQVGIARAFCRQMRHRRADHGVVSRIGAGSGPVDDIHMGIHHRQTGDSLTAVTGQKCRQPVKSQPGQQVRHGSVDTVPGRYHDVEPAIM